MDINYEALPNVWPAQSFTWMKWFYLKQHCCWVFHKNVFLKTKFGFGKFVI